MSLSADRDPAGLEGAVTPMMAQFFEIKAINPGYLLFYRMGDFYELFFEDAEIASRALGITLTKRGKHLGEDIPMCGVPIHAANDYLARLIRLGHKVAICEQTEDPAEARKRGGKSVVRREVVRLVTPGTLTEDAHLPARAHNFLAAVAMLHHGETDFALAWADISTGECFVSDLAAEAVGDELARIDPAELILAPATRQALAGRHLLPPSLAERITERAPDAFDSEAGAERVRDHFAGAADPSAWSRAVRAALGALLDYATETQKGARVALRPPVSETAARHMQIDAATRASLELLVTQRGETRGALRATIDMTMTPAGARLLAARLAAPLVDARAINDRLDMVDALIEDAIAATRLRGALKSAPDITRALSRLALERGGPRDLKAIGRAVTLSGELAGHLGGLALPPPGIARLKAVLDDAPRALGDRLTRALAEELPLLARDGGFVAEGFDGELDTQRALSGESRQVIARLQGELCEATGIRALKIKHNNMLGFFVEVPSAQGEALLRPPHAESFIHRQTMANAMRFTTGPLADLEGRIARAQETALGVELAIFANLREAALAERTRLEALADALAELDVTAALALLAAERGYVRPVVDDSLAFRIEGGRHPVVEAMLARDGAGFVANDCDLSAPIAGEGGKLWLVTGPNMGGKSTFLRQNALIAILAQMGSFVPAAAAHIGLVDKVFSRVGASDDIAQGRSTFMVEMVETASILNRATQRSLVILDEIGRGTATFDGLSIAWACVEALHETTRCRALFATHYHELTGLHRVLARVFNHTMKVREYRGDVVFLHEVMEGTADRSYGLQVAKLAGLPPAVLKRARTVLDQLEKRGQGGPVAVVDDLPLFSQANSQVMSAPQPLDNPVLDMLEAVRPDDMTPKQALEWIYQLKKASNADSGR